MVSLWNNFFILITKYYNFNIDVVSTLSYYVELAVVQCAFDTSPGPV